MERCSPSLASRDTQIETTLRYHLAPVRTAFINETRTNQCWRGRGVKAACTHCRWECGLVQPLRKTARTCLEKLRTGLPCDPAIPLLGMYPTNLKTFTFIHVYSSQDMEMSFDRWPNKDVVHIYTGIRLGHKKWRITICDNIDGSWQRHAKWTKSDGKGLEPYGFTHVWDMK